ncbi:hypothetical protein [Corynebacterium xerosis]|nr:hypothetical protein [Corynebacterium xerosis]
MFLQLLDGRAAQGGGDMSVHLITTAAGLIAPLALSSDEVHHWVRHRS